MDRLPAPIQLQLADNDHVTQFSCKPDGAVIAVGFKTGSTRLYNSELKLLSTAYHQNKLIVALAWHPASTVEDEDSNGNWLASASKEHNVYVYNCDESMEVVGVLNTDSLIKCIVWSTHKAGLLACASESTIYVRLLTLPQLCNRMMIYFRFGRQNLTP